MGIVEGGHDGAEDEGDRAVLVDLAQELHAEGGQQGADVGEDDLGEIGPGAAGGGQLGPFIRRLAGHGDHGHVGNIREVPADMAGDKGQYDDDGRDDLAADADELEGVEERHDPRQHNQPGAVAAPLLGLDRVEDRAIDPAEAGVNGGGQGADQAGQER